MVSILCDALQHRSVLLLPRPILGTSSHATDFVISGKHVASLFDYVPVNDTAYVYGSLQLEEKGLEDDMELVDKANMRWEKRRFVTTRERHYEDWLDTIPKGIGNTKRISFVCSNKQAYWVSISLAPSSWSMSVGPS